MFGRALWAEIARARRAVTLVYANTAAGFPAADARFRRPLMYNGRLMRKSCKKNKDGANDRFRSLD